MQWNDPRVQFYNLHPSSDQNTLLEEEKSKIWIPSVTFVNTARQERSLRDNSSLVNVDRRGGFERSSLGEVKNIYIYQGNENPLMITRVYSTKWLCTYDMLWYPFDTQVLAAPSLCPSGRRSASCWWRPRATQALTWPCSSATTPTPATGSSPSTSSGSRIRGLRMC